MFSGWHSVGASARGHVVFVVSIIVFNLFFVVVYEQRSPLRLGMMTLTEPVGGILVVKHQL